MRYSFIIRDQSVSQPKNQLGNQSVFRFNIQDQNLQLTLLPVTEFVSENSVAPEKIFKSTN